MKPESEQTDLLEKARGYLRLASELCNDCLGQTASMRNEVEDVRKMLRDSTLNLPVSNKERQRYLLL